MGRRVWGQILLTHTECKHRDSPWTNEKKPEERNPGVEKKRRLLLQREQWLWTFHVHYIIEEQPSLDMKSQWQQGKMSKTCWSDHVYSCKHRLLICLRRHSFNRQCEYCQGISICQKVCSWWHEGTHFQLCTEVGRRNEFCPVTSQHIHTCLWSPPEGQYADDELTFLLFVLWGLFGWLVGVLGEFCLFLSFVWGGFLMFVCFVFNPERL